MNFDLFLSEQIFFHYKTNEIDIYTEAVSFLWMNSKAS